MMISGSADESLRIWDMAKNKISPYISIKRPEDKVVITNKGQGEEDFGGGSDDNEGNQDPMRGVERKK